MTSPKTVYLLSNISNLGKCIQNLASGISIRHISVPDGGMLSKASSQDLENADILIADPGLIKRYNLLPSLSQLKWMQSTWAGVDAIFSLLDPSEAFPKFQLTRFAGCFGSHMSEYVIGHIVARERKFEVTRQQQANKTWARESVNGYRLLSQLHIGILGVGDIGKHVAASCKHFGMTVWALSNSPVTSENRSSNVDHYRQSPHLNDILSNCDYIVNFLPSTEATRNLLGNDTLAQCAKKPVFINLGRGDVIDEASLFHALRQEWISHAILDVFEKEPLPGDCKLWEHPQVTITPHISAESFDWQVAEVFAKNFERYVKKEPLMYVVDWKRGY